MDLLRLVLAKQPLAKLVNLKRLIGSDAFLNVRMETVNCTKIPLPAVNRKDWYLKYCTLEGELWQKSFLNVELNLLRLRAIFLRYSGGFKQFRDYSSYDTLTWAYLESDVLEIQARALVQAFLAARRGDRITVGAFMVPYKSLTRINWTSQLRNVISQIIASFWKHSNNYRMKHLAGFLRLPYDMDDGSENYLSGYLTSFTNGDTVETLIPECEAAIKLIFPKLGAERRVKVITESGYMNFSYSSSWDPSHAVEFGFKYARLPILHKYMQKLVKPFIFVIPDEYVPKKLVLRVREILDDPIIGPLIPLEVLEEYAAIAGNISALPLNRPMRILTGNKPEFYEFPEVPQYFGFTGAATYQASVVYDPLYSFYEDNKGIGKHVGYQRGLGAFMGTELEPEKSPETPEMMGNPELAKLLGVKDNTANSAKHEETYQQILKMLTP